MIISLETRLLYYCWLGGFLEGSDNLRQQKMGTATTIRGSIDLDVSKVVQSALKKMLIMTSFSTSTFKLVTYLPLKDA